MSGKITALQNQQHNEDRVNVYLNGKFAFGLSTIAAARLRVGQMLSDNEINQLQEADGITKAYERAVRFLATRPRSIHEVRCKLQENSTPSEVIDIVIDRLTQAGYVDDLEFARFWVRNRQEFRPRGAVALRAELRVKGVSEAIIAEVLTLLDPLEGALSAARQKLRSFQNLDTPTFRQKLGNYLVRRGFDYETARTVTDILIEERNEE